jgi:predicted amidohydrolase
VALGRTKEVPVPAGARRIEGRGPFLNPGHADMHAHVVRV